jgi:aminopeptidase N
LAQQWKNIQPKVGELFEFMNAKFGKYPYSQFSVIQGGDGGMEYPMCTMIRGHGSFNGKLGLIAHEAFHNWYYGVLATNEAKYPWMDEGFTSFAENIVMDSILNQNQKNPLQGYYQTYARFTRSPLHEPMSIHADHFKTNAAYSISSYVKGAIFLQQMSYITGERAFYDGMINYFNQWKFKHPEPRDFKRVMEKTTGLELDWYLESWINSTNTIDYGVESVEKDRKQTIVTIEKIGEIPMPLDILVTYDDGEEELFYIPITLMRGEKENETSLNRTTLADWSWVNPEYTFTIDRKKKNIASIQIDPSEKMADVDLENNLYSSEK